MQNFFTIINPYCYHHNCIRGCTPGAAITPFPLEIWRESWNILSIAPRAIVVL